LLLCIDGLLPIHFRNNNYKIPVAIWIPQDYPQSPPMVFVTPRKDMIVKPSRNVDANGKCYHPNLANWSADPNVHPFIYTVLIILERELQNKQSTDNNTNIPTTLQ
jgi:ubiquitin-protein ligase